MTHGRHTKPSTTIKALRTTGPLVASGAVVTTLLTVGQPPNGSVSVTASQPKLIEANLTDFTVSAKPTFTPTYTVELGNTLSGIADRYCGSWNDWPAIYDANKNVVGGNPNIIEVGEKLKLNCKISALAASYVAKQAAPKAVAPSTDGLGSMISQLDGQGYDGSAMATTALFLFQHGYSRIGAAGVVACIAGESGGNPESVGDGGGGLIGWTPLSVPVTGNVGSDLNAQLEALLQYNDRFGSVSALNGQSSPVAAADFYSQNFERPAVIDSDVRSAVAYIVYAGL